MAESQETIQEIRTDTLASTREIFNYMRSKHVEFIVTKNEADMRVYVYHEDEVTMKPLYEELKEKFPDRVFWE
jgi:hypothetical protein